MIIANTVCTFKHTNKYPIKNIDTGMDTVINITEKAAQAAFRKFLINYFIKISISI